MSDSPEDLCPVCLEEYQESGPHVPRILPCSHTVCEWCLIQLLRGGSKLKCPKCKAQHAAPNRERSFPQNRYLLRLIRLRNVESSESEHESEEEVKKCPEHGKELTLFCKETQCQKLICTVCMTRKHKKHDVVDVDENQKDELVTSLTSAIESLSFKKDQITAVQKKNDRCLKTLQEEKMSILTLVRDKYDSLIREAENQTEEFTGKMVPLEENLILLNNIKEYINRAIPSWRETNNYQETVSSVTKHNNQAPLELYYVEYTENKDKERLVEELCGELMRQKHKKEQDLKQYKQPEETGELLVKQFDYSHQISNICGSFQKSEEPLASRDMGNASVLIPSCLREFQPRTRTISTASPKRRVLPRFQLKRSIETPYKNKVPLYLSAAGRDSLIICGRDADGKYSLTHYNLLTGEERCTVKLDRTPYGMTTVLHNNQTCIALSYYR